MPFYANTDVIRLTSTFFAFLFHIYRGYIEYILKISMEARAKGKMVLNVKGII